ncbi:MAG: peptide chain release factor N(5)-glutamine methyltransferase [Clostridia bacterium]|nr:peptide chain release factor N(5)-glutamine methyltransferase [Clostridia bacterium]
MKTKIGGQAVLEGVMMRGATCQALAVRDENGNILVESTRLRTKKPWYAKVPFVRGVANLVSSLTGGMKTIAKSAEVFVEDEMDEGDSLGGMMAISMLFGIVLALALFIFLPTQLTTWIMKAFNITDVKWVRSIIEGVVKLAVLVGYMTSITGMKEIKRVYMYHGAEHKTIACYEAELPLTVQNVQKCSRYHDRCGTSFLVFVVVLSVLLMVAVEAIFHAAQIALIDKTWFRTLIKVAMLPLTAAVSYEMLMLLAKSNFVLFRPLKWLGKQFQKLTTREPDDQMCEVAIAAFQKVLQMDADLSMPEEHFPGPSTLAEFKPKAKALCDLSVMEEADLDWMLCHALKLSSRSKLTDDLTISYGWQNRIYKMIERCNNGEPWQYVMGNTNFYGREFEVNKWTLVPRMETELVCEQAILRTTKDSRVLDLCCGSGAIGLTIKAETGANVVLTDLSPNAVKVAKQNAKNLGLSPSILCGDMFSKVVGKFDVIVSNPPYIATAVIPTLDAKVKNYEPHTALDGGADGLDFYRIIASQAPSYLVDGGTLVLEIGFDQAKAVVQLLQDNFVDVQVKKDYSGNDRIVIATKK